MNWKRRRRRGQGAGGLPIRAGRVWEGSRLTAQCRVWVERRSPERSSEREAFVEFDNLHQHQTVIDLYVAQINSNLGAC